MTNFLNLCEVAHRQDTWPWGAKHVPPPAGDDGSDDVDDDDDNTVIRWEDLRETWPMLIIKI